MYELWLLNPGESKYLVTKFRTDKAKFFDGVKGKTYKCKVRGYRNVNGTKVYSSFSTQKSIKVPSK